MSAIEGGEIGSGYSMLAMFEIIPTSKNISSLKDYASNGKLADIQLQYQLPNSNKESQMSYTSRYVFTPPAMLDKCYHFSSAIAMFGALLRSSPFVRNISWNEIIELAISSSGTNDLLQQEFISLLQHAKSLYSKTKKKKGNGTSW